MPGTNFALVDSLSDAHGGSSFVEALPPEPKQLAGTECIRHVQFEQQSIPVILFVITITSMSQETVQGAIMARGTALLALDRLYSPSHSREPRTEHWMLSLTYYLNPKQVSDQAKIYPQYEFINPLGLTITEFHENRVSVDPIAPGTPTAATDGAVR